MRRRGVCENRFIQSLRTLGSTAGKDRGRCPRPSGICRFAPVPARRGEGRSRQGATQRRSSCYWSKAANAGGLGAEPLRDTELPKKRMSLKISRFARGNSRVSSASYAEKGSPGLAPSPRPAALTQPSQGLPTIGIQTPRTFTHRPRFASKCIGRRRIAPVQWAQDRRIQDDGWQGPIVWEVVR